MGYLTNYYLQKTADGDFAQVHKVLQGQLQAAPFPTLYNSYTPTGYQLDHLSVCDWIEQYVTGGHSSNMGHFLDVAYNEEYGRETKEQSSLNLVYLLGPQPMPGNFSIFGKSDERYHIVGGNQQLPTAIANSLPAGSINLNWKVKDPSPKRDGLAKKYRPGNGKRARATPRLAWPRSGFFGNGAI